MKSKGFTLIELLAVIVILAIIALIATPIILNIIEDAKEESAERSVEMYAKAIQNSIAKSQLNNNEEIVGTFSSSTDGKTLTGATTLTVEYDGDKVVCTTIEIYEDGNIYLAGCGIGSEGNYTYGTKQVSPVCKVIEDNDTSKTITKGDKVSCEFENSTENFYVVSNNGTNVEMLTEFNLDVGTKAIYQADSYGYTTVLIEDATGIQKSEAKGLTDQNGEFNPMYPSYGVIQYISSDDNLYWFDTETLSFKVDTNYLNEGRKYPYVYGTYEQNNLYPHVENYVNYLIDNGLTGATGKLLSYEQAEQLGCSTSSCSSAPTWINSTSYWLGSVDNDGYPYQIEYNSAIHVIDYLNDYAYGVRPLIILSESLIDKNI